VPAGCAYYLNELLRTFAREMTARDESALAWLEAARPNLVAAARQAAEGGWHETVWELAGALCDFFDLRKHWDDWRVTSELGLAAARQAGDKAAEAGIVHAGAGRLDAATEAIERAVALFRQLGDEHATAVALGNLGIALMLRGERDGAVEASQGSLDLLDRVGDRHGRVRALWNLAAVVASARGEEAAEPLRAAAQVAIDQLDADRASELRPLRKVTDPAATALRWWAITR
jgi:tetratricopeptide (TPR) repeat protein